MPIDSMNRIRSCLAKCSLPLKAMCSTKWARPSWSASSTTDPTLTTSRSSARWNGPAVRPDVVAQAVGQVPDRDARDRRGPADRGVIDLRRRRSPAGPAPTARPTAASARARTASEPGTFRAWAAVWRSHYELTRNEAVLSPPACRPWPRARCRGGKSGADGGSRSGRGRVRYTCTGTAHTTGAQHHGGTARGRAGRSGGRGDAGGGGRTRPRRLPAVGLPRGRPRSARARAAAAAPGAARRGRGGGPRARVVLRPDRRRVHAHPRPGAPALGAGAHGAADPADRRAGRARAAGPRRPVRGGAPRPLPRLEALLARGGDRPHPAARRGARDGAPATGSRRRSSA